ncbi:MAG: GNAT family N-acetyltransferase [Furfurilactobacillus sp.]|jgi:ribosomal protein S18 acetylase RimI-like enzyme|uniref:GNAT family N-acetyltransferase n=1 Tax=Furfurilactobacillus sp. TaxID=2767911 RepID=UPI00258633A0|nr:GNAT family N-acetyltransferase [Furfurilactobacillus sp.]MCH4011467.1 GNAT family N-acetyltransferase [Furfurilactobacillus sp.]MCH4037359.1 GNAT family N-acetyltransferase [Furfurilactobacillus sp.]MCH4116005.1 GNAT family N-acetyltransferase [Furfurilactobacillus sp.]MCH4133348.1 GNAT family N-acetyltransferase [Furfurilactobacillus sp.]MCI1339503.1 GNAT family N-acetyltransferase [Furfurilactobacillus sp.]
MQIRDYRPADEQSWLQCRVLSFMDSSYFQDVQQHRQTFARPSVELVVIQENKIIGLIDAEIDSQSMTDKQESGAMIWNLAVLPEYRRQGIAKDLWQAMRKRLLDQDIHYCELWTQEDVPANRFYQHNGFKLDTNATYLRCKIGGRELPLALSKHFNKTACVEEMTFEAQVSEREQLQPLCDEIIETRMYTQHF